MCSASKVGSVPLALDPHRWVQLGILSMLALLSDWTCFATVAVPSEWMTLEGHDAAELIDIFLASNVVSCFLFTDIAARLGLKKVVTGAATMMAGGAAHGDRDGGDGGNGGGGGDGGDGGGDGGGGDSGGATGDEPAGGDGAEVET